MTNHTDSTLEQTNSFNQIREGMKVYDSDRKNIGTVETVYSGSASDAELAGAGGSVPATVADTPTRMDSPFSSLDDIFDPEDKIPKVVADRLLYNGFIKIDAGWFGADRYVMPNQISFVRDGEVFLSKTCDQLVKE